MILVTVKMLFLSFGHTWGVSISFGGALRNNRGNIIHTLDILFTLSHTWGASKQLTTVTTNMFSLILLTLDNAWGLHINFDPLWCFNKVYGFRFRKQLCPQKKFFFKETNAKSIIFQTSACIRATHSLVRIPVGIYFQWKIFIYLTSLSFWFYRPFSVAPSSVLPSQSRSFLSRL